MKILIVDDDENHLLILGEMLISLGFEILSARNGQEGLRFLDPPAEEKISLVITDGRMPVMDGPGMTRRIKIIRNKLPVIMITGENERFQEEAKKSGVDAVFLKPACLSDLKETIERLLS